MQNKTYIAKKGINVSDVMYLTRDGRKTVINLADGSNVDTFKPIKELMKQLPEDEFEIINKGIAVSSKYVICVENNEYHMKDGSCFKGRVRKIKKQEKDVSINISDCMRDGWNQFSILDKLPMAFCIIELVFDENGHGIDFIFRYCNDKMEELEGKPISEMIDKSFYEIFENGDKKWLITYADIALNGGEKMIESYSPEIGANLRIYCFQPKPYFCACTLIKV